MPGRGRVRALRLVLARARDRVGLHRAPRPRALLRRKAAALLGDAALGHDRAAGRALYAPARCVRDVGDERGTAQPGNRGEAVERGRAPGSRALALFRVFERPDRDPESIYNGWLVPH